MSRRPIENIDEKVLLATIEVAGGTMEVNRFSTKDIAAKAGCSEFVVYSHFKTKEKLIDATNAYSLKVFIDLSKEAIAKSTSLLDVFLQMLDQAVNYPTATDFCANYARIFPRAKIPSDYESYRNRMRVLTDLYSLSFPFLKEDRNERMQYLLMSHFLRELVISAKTIAHHEIVDTPEVRLLMARSAILGLSAYSRIA
jgi:Bacterial regulatory proteins, tetR family.